MRLPQPSGPFRVGSSTYLMEDSSRPCHLMSTVPGRRLYLKLWYPAQPGAAHAPEVLWKELRVPGRAPWLMRQLMRLIPRGTSSYPEAPFAASAPALPPVLYNHGLISFAAENTSLMQELASRGHVVIAIEHRDQLPEWQALTRQQPSGQKRVAQQLMVQLRGADAAQRALLAKELYAASPNTRRLVVERAQDTRLVLDKLTSALARVPGRPCRPADGTAHLVGYSVGGAVATEVAAQDQRAVSVVNLDGGVYGSHDARAITAPYLMMYSAGNEGINDELLPSHTVRQTYPGTNHLSYHDVAGVLPPLRWLRAAGPADPQEVLTRRNRGIAEHLGAVRKGPLEHSREQVSRAP